MRSAIPLLLLLLVSRLPLFAVPAVEEVSGAWAEARLSGDADAIRAALADGFAVVFPDGSTGDAEAFVTAIVDGSRPALSRGSAELGETRVYDGAAILHGVYVFTESVETTEWVDERRKAAGHTKVVKVEKSVTREVEARVRFTEFWVGDRGRLRLAMVQLTPVGSVTPDARPD